MMYRRLSIFMLIVLCAACKKGQQTSACGTQACTALFTSIGVTFKDKNNNAVNVINYKVIDLRTNKEITITPPPNIDVEPGYKVIIDDSSLKDLSSDGDSIQVTATNPATNEAKATLFKISGGLCNCHVSKLSGPDTIVFTQ